jgi:hypothetical protein
MPYSDDMRPCARGVHCADRQIVIDDGRRIVEPAWTYRPFCDLDRQRLITCIEAIPGQYVDLYRKLLPSGSGGQRVSGSRTPPIPMVLNVEALMREVVHVVCSWAEVVGHVANLSSTDGPRRAGTALSEASKALAIHVDALLALGSWSVTRYMDIHKAADLPADTIGWVHPHAGYVEAIVDLDGPAAALELLDLHAKCRSVLGLTKKREILTIPCHGCGHAALHREETSQGMEDGATCGNCRTEYTGDQWKLLRDIVYGEQIAARKAG